VVSEVVGQFADNSHYFVVQSLPMKRRFQRASSVAPAMSAVLCAATILLWARSCWPDWADPFPLRTFGGSGLTSDRTVAWDPRDGVKVQFSNGRSYISWATHTNKPSLAGHHGCVVDNGVRSIGWDCACYGRQQLAGTDNHQLVFPLPLAAAVFLAASAWPGALRVKRRLTAWHAAMLLAKRGLCPNCGYDLRATPEL